MPKIKRGWIITGAIILLLAILNPTKQDYREYLDVKGINIHHYDEVRGGRTSYFIIFSLYEYNAHKEEWPYIIDRKRKHIGILKNFIEIGN